jgi:shikimate kinase
MPDAKIIFLIGMPGVGKSFWGDKIAKAYSLQFVDLDLYIAEQEQASISALFAKYGENGFREKEQKYLKKIIDNATTDMIVSSGGGTPGFADNMQLMKAAGTVLYLEAGIPYLLNNLKNSEEIRPLLNGRRDLGAYLDTLLQKRNNIYRQSHYILHTKDISLITFDKIISSCISRH